MESEFLVGHVEPAASGSGQRREGGREGQCILRGIWMERGQCAGKGVGRE